MMAALKQGNVAHTDTGPVRKLLLRQAFGKSLLTQNFCECFKEFIIGSGHAGSRRRGGA